MQVKVIPRENTKEVVKKKKKYETTKLIKGKIE